MLKSRHMISHRRTRSNSRSTIAVITTSAIFAASAAACSGSVTSTPLAITADAGGSAPIDASTPPIDAGVDADNGAPSNVFPAPHATAPIVESYSSSPIVLASPRVQPVVFAGDAEQTKITSFTHAFSGSEYWNGATAEYGVGDIAASDPIVVPATDTAFTTVTTITDAQIQSFLAAHLDGTHADWGSPDANTIYTVFYPVDVTITLDPFGQSCQGFGGYHSFTTVGTTQIPYAVIPRCTELGTLQGVDDVMTGASSHELIEAATDPFSTGYDSADEDYFYYDLQPLSEIGDMCAFESDAFYQPAELGFSVQRVWSNALAAKGGSPCAPLVASSIYFAAVPNFDTHVDMNFGSGVGDIVPRARRANSGRAERHHRSRFDQQRRDGSVQRTSLGHSDHGRKTGRAFVFARPELRSKWREAALDDHAHRRGESVRRHRVFDPRVRRQPALPPVDGLRGPVKKR